MPQNNVICNFIVTSIFKNVKELNVFPAFSWMFDQMEKAYFYNQKLSGSIDYIALPVQ